MSNGAIEPRTHDIAANNVTLRVVTWGERNDPERAVMLVHGITANSHYWSDAGPELARRGWFPIALDLRGRGKSEKPPHGYGLPFHANDILALCDHFELATVNYVGHSLGGLIGLYLAAVYRHRVRKLVLVDAGGKLPPDAMEAIAPALARLGTVYPSLDAYLEAMLGSPHFSGDRAFWERYFRYDAETRPDGTTVSCVPREAITEEQASLFLTRTEVLPEFIKAPTLIIRATEGLLGGERGQILPSAEAERLRDIIAASRVVEIEGANHYSVVLAERFTEDVVMFLNP
ncbi:MAG TPA: alpha/beta hydrolase [Thermomicrobiales bacterium]|nr:alpha/beta hydrolase [Thermomicrobiales bacterium]